MRAWLSTYGARRDVEPIVGLAVRMAALGAAVRVCAAVERDAPVAIGVASNGGSR